MAIRKPVNVVAGKSLKLKKGKSPKTLLEKLKNRIRFSHSQVEKKKYLNRLERVKRALVNQKQPTSKIKLVEQKKKAA